MDEAYFKKVMTSFLLLALLVLSYFLIQPILLSIILGILLAFVFSPLYDWINKRVSSGNLSASIVSVILALILIIPFWFIVPIVIDQSFKIYQALQTFDFVTPLKTVFPGLFATEGLSSEIGTTLHTFTTNIANYVVNAFGDILLNLPTIALQFLIVAFTFFFVLRDKEEIMIYVKSLLPFSKEVEAKIFNYSRGITFSVLYGHIIIGLVQGIIVGLGFYIFKVPNALFLTFIAVILGILPIIGTAAVWIPTAIYMLSVQGTLPAFGISVFGLLSFVAEQFIRPFFIAKRTQINSALILIGMIGGVFLFGILGVILGPLIIGYLLIILEVYRNTRMPGILIQPEQQKAS
jgi:predicted PurR-regulated permease PerM